MSAAFAAATAPDIFQGSTALDVLPYQGRTFRVLLTDPDNGRETPLPAVGSLETCVSVDGSAFSISRSGTNRYPFADTVGLVTFASPDP
jgi:hypothetical protein